MISCPLCGTTRDATVACPVCATPALPADAAAAAGAAVPRVPTVSSASAPGRVAAMPARPVVPTAGQGSVPGSGVRGRIGGRAVNPGVGSSEPSTPAGGVPVLTGAGPGRGPGVGSGSFQGRWWRAVATGFLPAVVAVVITFVLSNAPPGRWGMVRFGLDLRWVVVLMAVALVPRWLGPASLSGRGKVGAGFLVAIPVIVNWYGPKVMAAIGGSASALLPVASPPDPSTMYDSTLFPALSEAGLDAVVISALAVGVGLLLGSVGAIVAKRARLVWVGPVIGLATTGLIVAAGAVPEELVDWVSRAGAAQAFTFRDRARFASPGDLTAVSLLVLVLMVVVPCVGAALLGRWAVGEDGEDGRIDRSGSSPTS